jgi:hypothetical protein
MPFGIQGRLQHAVEFIGTGRPPVHGRQHLNIIDRVHSQTDWECDPPRDAQWCPGPAPGVARSTK